MNQLTVNADSARRAYKEGSAETRRAFEALWPDTFIPAPSWNEITSFDQVLKAKPDLTEEELALINYSGKSTRMRGARGFMKASLITEVINEGWVADYDNSDQKKWEIIWVKTPAGFGLSYARAFYDYASTDVGVRLCFETEEKARHAAKHFAAEWNELLIINK